ncbi:MAG TPA: serine/threonine-protein kinase [Actinospica sp.]|nr:serine/threonine-protein kinase [Actinospica sp.]
MVTDGGEVIAGRYRLISQLGSGAMGVVWRAHDERLGRTVAVKKLRAPVGLSSTQIEQAHGRARREARIAARLQHAHAVAVYDVVEHEGRPCLVMEYVPSRSLAQVLAHDTALPPAEVAKIGAGLAAALIAAHEAGIVHRDIKPGNILIADNGAVKLTDFGISRASGDVTVTATGEMLGTPAYISPEVAQGRTAGAASDVFSLGATLYAALEGTPPFGIGPNAMALLLRIVNGEIRQPEQSGALVDTIMWMLNRDPEARPSMGRVRRELESATEETVTDIAPPPPPVEDHVDEGQDEEPEAHGVEAAPEVKPAPAKVKQPPKQTPKPKPKQPSKPRSRVLAGVFLSVAAVMTAAIVAAITVHNHARGSAAAPPATTHASSQAVAATTGAKAGKSASATHSASSSATATQGSSATSSASASATASGSVTQQLSTAITHYYSLMPGGTDQAWNYLTASYQQNTARSEAYYKSFWSAIQSVSLSGLQAQAPSTVVVTLTYDYKNGQTVQERTRFGLVQQGGVWKINTSSVLSSTTS